MEASKVFIFLICMLGLLFMGAGIKSKNSALESLGVFIEMLAVAFALVFLCEV